VHLTLYKKEALSLENNKKEIQEEFIGWKFQSKFHPEKEDPEFWKRL
jgi:hypothetical protein